MSSSQSLPGEELGAMWEKGRSWLLSSWLEHLGQTTKSLVPLRSSLGLTTKSPYNVLGCFSYLFITPADEIWIVWKQILPMSMGHKLSYVSYKDLCIVFTSCNSICFCCFSSFGWASVPHWITQKRLQTVRLSERKSNHRSGKASAQNSDARYMAVPSFGLLLAPDLIDWNQRFP